VEAQILIVGDDPTLLLTRASLLKDWQTTSVITREAEAAIRAQAYDLLIFCRTVPDRTAEKLISLANQLHPPATSLLLCSTCGADRRFGTAMYRVDFGNPGGLRTAVASCLASLQTTTRRAS
jgi:hypothetical protein